MTEDQTKRLEELTKSLVDRCISEPEYIEYQELSEILLNDMKHLPSRRKISESYK